MTDAPAPDFGVDAELAARPDSRSSSATSLPPRSPGSWRRSLAAPRRVAADVLDGLVAD